MENVPVMNDAEVRIKRTDRIRLTTADLELLPDNGNHYEIIDGELSIPNELIFEKIWRLNLC